MLLLSLRLLLHTHPLREEEGKEERR